jgi:hypothetical protein
LGVVAPVTVTSVAAFNRHCFLLAYARLISKGVMEMTLTRLFFATLAFLGIWSLSSESDAQTGGGGSYPKQMLSWNKLLLCQMNIVEATEFLSKQKAISENFGRKSYDIRVVQPFGLKLTDLSVSEKLDRYASVDYSVIGEYEKVREELFKQSIVNYQKPYSCKSSENYIMGSKKCQISTTKHNYAVVSVGTRRLRNGEVGVSCYFQAYDNSEGI